MIKTAFCISSLVILIATGGPVQDPEIDISKRRIESPLESKLIDAGRTETEEKNRDPSKSLVEAPLERSILAGTNSLQDPKQDPDPVVDMRKREIEYGPETVVENSTEIKDSEEVKDKVEILRHLLEESVREAPDNPEVKPGDVTWHENFESACEASKESGKPVLLFQLLGELDQRFT